MITDQLKQIEQLATGRAPSMSTCRISQCSGVPGKVPIMSTCLLSQCSGVPGRAPARDADRSRNDNDNHNSGAGSRRIERTPELALLCGRMFPGESDKIEKYVDGLPDMIHGSVMASKPTTMQDAVEFATELWIRKSALLLNVRLRIKESKMITNSNKTRGKTLAGPILLGLGRRSQIGDLSHCALNATITMMVRVLPNATRATQNRGHYRTDSLKLKNQNYENQAGGTGARGMVHALGGGETNQDLNNMEDDINA
uniref:Reverse transcriptase domain-containing protein n=1 Tax=Tanacetum cinerariifolium TaxID=118510 RepID=A0A6L2LS63_TANCI|nr:hypothetical protein [Tanacetum cinerariifolium]